MIKTTFCLLIVIGLAISAAAQKNGKPWTEWSAKDAVKVLTDSAWAQTQTDLVEPPASGSAVTRTSSPNEIRMISSEAAKGLESGETIGKKGVAMSLNYRISFLSAKPIRAAFIRMIELQKPEATKEEIAQLRTFVDRDFADFIVVTLIVDGTDKKRIGPAMQEINSADPAVLKNTTYLERKDGKRLALHDYRAPTQDGLGAKFVFPRTLDGKPFLDAETSEVRFLTQAGKAVKLNMRFKVTEMVYDGKLEY